MLIKNPLHGQVKLLGGPNISSLSRHFGSTLFGENAEEIFKTEAASTAPSYNEYDTEWFVPQAVHTKISTENLPVYDNNGNALKQSDSVKVIERRITESCPCDLQDERYDKLKTQHSLSISKGTVKLRHVHAYRIKCSVCQWYGRVEENNKQYATPLHGVLLKKDNQIEHCAGVYALTTSETYTILNVEHIATEKPFSELADPHHWCVYNEWTGKYLIDEKGTEDPDSDKAYWFTDKNKLDLLLGWKNIPEGWLHVNSYGINGYSAVDPSKLTKIQKATFRLYGYCGDDEWPKYYPDIDEVLTSPAYDYYAIVKDGIVVDTLDGIKLANMGYNFDGKVIKLRTKFSGVKPGWTFDGAIFKAPGRIK